VPPAFPDLSTRIAALTAVEMAFQVEIAKSKQEFCESGSADYSAKEFSNGVWEKSTNKISV
jgi:hypothetical protein